MNMPVYVSPEQLMKDRADFARKGVARGRPVIVVQYEGGILFVTENPSRSLHKIAEVYDRIGFAAVGKYNEFEKLRVLGVRYADMRGYAYDRADVTARGLANAYAQMLGTAFTTDPKPLEVELVVAEVGETLDDDQIYRLSYDGSVADEPGFVVLGGGAAALRDLIAESWEPGIDFDTAWALAIGALRSGAGTEGKENGGKKGVGAAALNPKSLEVAVLERDRPGRKFRRLVGAALPEIPSAVPEGSGAERG
ncbi:MAG: proteasome subunit alpha [Promicromonosporaceae bacterium]|nr:proteasome subunit alpha [Promicromonosporaceae bacterium]